MTCEHVLDDGAYVLGALSPAERADFERHLSTCASCREAVASMAVLPGLLGRLEPARAIALASANLPEPTPAPPSLLPRVLAAAAQQRRFTRRKTRRRRMAYGFATALSVLLLVFGAGFAVHMRDVGSTPPVPMTAMRPAQQEWVPISADIGLVSVKGGSKLVMTCWYGSEYEGSEVMRLVIFSTDGGPGESIGTWRADPGAKFTISGWTYLAAAQVKKVVLERASDDTPLLWWAPS